MKKLLILTTLIFVQPAMSAQKWFCDDGERVKVYFTSVSNSVISNVIVLEGAKVLSQIPGEVERDPKFSSPTYKDYYRYHVSPGEFTLSILVDKYAAELDDEFIGYLQRDSGPFESNLINMTCIGVP
jgi:hypothetical protein